MSIDARTGDARGRLLARLLEEFGDDLPAPDLSLREVAGRIGSSHALLRYHFGSHAGLLAAMLSALRDRDNDALRLAAETASFPDFIQLIWQHYAAPDGLPRVNSFYYVVGLAVHDHVTFAGFIASLDELTSLLTSVAVREGASPKDAAVNARLAIATVRGLLLEYTFNDRDGTPVIRQLRQMLDR